MRNYINETERNKQMLNKRVEGEPVSRTKMVVSGLVIIGLMLMVGLILTTCQGVPA